MALINKLEAIGDSIRGKSGKSDLLTLDEMVEEIDALEVNPPLPPAEEEEF